MTFFYGMMQVVFYFAWSSSSISLYLCYDHRKNLFLSAHGRGKHGPELEYSDDEDFEMVGSTQHKAQDGPYPPAYGNGGGNGGNGEVKKHKKKKKSGDDKPSGSFLPAI